MRYSRRLVAVLIAGVIVALLSAMPQTANAADRAPFGLILVGQDTLVTDNCPTICTEHTGAGFATQFGAFKSSGFIVATSIRFLSKTQLKATTVETYVFTATTGDTLDVTNYATGIDDLTTGLTSITGHGSSRAGPESSVAPLGAERPAGRCARASWRAL
ncbi:MAG TPA: hypothetical protein VFU72_00115 [Nitrolancea sp.]|nr:hypothetical protein [Nitrolancea sp.]